MFNWVRNTDFQQVLANTDIGACDTHNYERYLLALHPDPVAPAPCVVGSASASVADHTT